MKSTSDDKIKIRIFLYCLENVSVKIITLKPKWPRREKNIIITLADLDLCHKEFYSKREKRNFNDISINVHLWLMASITRFCCVSSNLTGVHWHLLMRSLRSSKNLAPAAHHCLKYRKYFRLIDINYYNSLSFHFSWFFF